MTTKTAIRIIQKALKAAGRNPGPIDGEAGAKTRKAFGLELKKKSGQLPDGWEDWTERRKGIAYLQILATEAGYDAGPIDGLWGPMTEHGVDSLIHKDEHNEDPEPWRDWKPGKNPNKWPPQDPQSKVTAFYGPAGKKSNLVKLEFPYTMRLSWELSSKVNSTSCHKKVHDSAKRVLGRVLETYGFEKIKELRLDLYGGCFNNRSMRGGTRKSMHAWGIAFDFDPDRNQLKWGREKAAFAKPAYDKWWESWENEGWTSLGRARNFDWMHVQAARLD